MVRLPYSRTLERKSELLALEQDLRALLQCQSRQCAFLQSSEYATVKFNVLRALLGNNSSSSSAEEDDRVVVHIPGSTLLMHVSTDATNHRADILVQSQPLPLAAAEQQQQSDEEEGEVDHDNKNNNERKRKALLKLCVATKGSNNKRGRRCKAAEED